MTITSSESPTQTQQPTQEEEGQTPIDLSTDPFGVDMNDSEQVAGLPGLSGIIRKFVPKLRPQPHETPPPAALPHEPNVPPPEQFQLQPQDDFTKPDRMLEDMQEMPSAWHLQGRPPGGNVNLNYYKDVRTRQALDLLNKYEGRFQNYSVRTPVPHSVTIMKSQEQATIDRVLGKTPSDMWEPEEVVAMAKMMEGSAENLKAGADAINIRLSNGANVSDEELTDFMQRYYQLQGMMQMYVGAASKAGRLLNAFNAIGKAGNASQYYQAIAEQLNRAGGRESAEQVVRALAESTNPEEAMRSTWALRSSQAWDTILKFRYNAMLSSVRTHVANITGSAFITLNENLIKRPLTIAFNKLEQGIRAVTPGLNQMDATQAMQWSEMWVIDRAAYDGVKEGFLAARDIARGKAIGDGKFMNEIGTRYNVDEVPTSTIGKIATSPVRMLEAEDAFFRAFNYQTELSRQAKRMSTSEGGTAAEIQARYQQLMAAPTDAMIEDANAFAKYAVMANDPNVYSKLLGSLATSVSAGANRHPFFRVMVPFIKTPANLLIYARDHTMPLVSSRFYEQVMSNKPAERAAALARLTEAVGMTALLYNYWEDGKITGVGHPSETARAAYMEAGWRPNSIMLGDNYYELNRTDPLGLMLGIVATGFDYHFASETEQDALSTAVNTIFSVAELMTDRSMLSSTADLISVIEGSAGTATRGDVAATIATLPAIMMPGIMRDIREMMDPIQRQMIPEKGTAEGMWERLIMRFKNAWPGLSEDLAPRRDWKGEIVQNQGNFLIRGLLPIRSSKRTNDPATLALVRYNIGISKEDTMLSLPGVGLELNLMRMDGHKGWIYNKLTEMIGKERYALVNKLVNSAAWASRNKRAETDIEVYEEQQDKLRSVMSEGRQRGVHEFLKWLDNKSFVRTPEGTRIDLVEVFHKRSYKDIDKEFVSGKTPNTEIYKRRQKGVLPTF